MIRVWIFINRRSNRPVREPSVGILHTYTRRKKGWHNPISALVNVTNSDILELFLEFETSGSKLNWIKMLKHTHIATPFRGDGRKRDYPIFDQILFWGSAWLYSVLKLINWFLHRSSSRQRSPHLSPKLTRPLGYKLGLFYEYAHEKYIFKSNRWISAELNWILTFQNSIISKLIIQNHFKKRIVIVCFPVGL